MPLVAPVVAACADTHISLYVDTNGGGATQVFCLGEPGGIGNLPNLNNIVGPCPQFAHANSWNDCVSSVRISVTATKCFATYRDANYLNVMAKYWGAIGPDTLFNVSPNDAMSSVKQYYKVPQTPAGNC